MNKNKVDRIPTKCDFKFRPGDEVEVRVTHQKREKTKDGNIEITGKGEEKRKAVIDHGVRRFRVYDAKGENIVNEHYNEYAVKLESGGIIWREENDIKIVRLAGDVKKKKRGRKSSKQSVVEESAAEQNDDGPTSITEEEVV